MSTARTGRAQRERLRRLGLRVALLPALRDVDRIADARAVAALRTGRPLRPRPRADAGSHDRRRRSSARSSTAACEPVLRDDRGRARALPVDVWLGRAGAVDERVLDRARGPVLDVGCGPGRHVHALARRGVLGVGVDVSPAAVALARRAGATVLEASIFDRLPGDRELEQRAAARRQHRHRRVPDALLRAPRRTARAAAGPSSSSSTRRGSAS